jgi:hypothetical protein
VRVPQHVSKRRAVPAPCWLAGAVQHADAMVVADVAARWVLEVQAGAVAAELEASADFHFAVHNAAGVVSVQEGISVTDPVDRVAAADREVSRG